MRFAVVVALLLAGCAAVGSDEFFAEKYSGVSNRSEFWAADLKTIGGENKFQSRSPEFKECVANYVNAGSTDELKAAVDRFIANKTAANYKNFPPKDRWFQDNGNPVNPAAYSKRYVDLCNAMFKD